MMMSDSNSHIPVRIIGYLSNKLMYINNNIHVLVTLTYPFQSIHFFCSKKDVIIKNQMLTLIIHVGNEGSGHWQ